MSGRGLLRIIEGGALGFWCPGCKCQHVVTTSGNVAWTFNGDYEKPTLEPSVLVRSGHYATAFREGMNCWCTYAKENPDDPVRYKCERCHLFLRNGMLEFLGDSTHELAGKTVPLTLAPERKAIEQ